MILLVKWRDRKIISCIIKILRNKIFILAIQISIFIIAFFQNGSIMINILNVSMTFIILKPSNFLLAIGCNIPSKSFLWTILIHKSFVQVPISCPSSYKSIWFSIFQLTYKEHIRAYRCSTFAPLITYRSFLWYFNFTFID